MKRPVINPTNSDIKGYIQQALDSFSRKFQNRTAGIVKSVKGRDTVVVVPAINNTDSDFNQIDSGPITLSVLTPFGGDMFLSFPLRPGDTGWICGADVDISAFKRNKSRPQKQDTMARHRYRHGFFVPDMINGFSVSSDDDGAIVMQSMDGNTKLTIRPNRIVASVGNRQLQINNNQIIINGAGQVIIDGINFAQHTHPVPSTGLVAPSGGGPVTGNATSQGPQ